MDNREIKKAVKEGYGKIAKKESSCCEPVSSSFGSKELAERISKKIGYTDEELKVVPEGANLGLGCGNPVALATLRKGETVLDLGAGAGFDCFLAANKVGKKGKVIGVDMTPEMIEKARENARKGKYENVEFRLGEIENLPVADNSVDVVISNCVINLSPDKKKVFKEAFRVLKQGGRLMVSDLVLLKEFPDSIKSSIESYVGCLTGAILKEDYIAAIERAGFDEVKIMQDEKSFSMDCMSNDPTAKAIMESFKISHEQLKEISVSVMSIRVYGLKPR
ncbi:MAG: arsenite S-adenosylmethyltransferase [Candidatus Schekmanbacteria bacterium RIFCSPHIGHO2_02_FULL_38_11]|uniref:Arsenite methyltransferase n=1 Tax=Candidatus Schekmanbacteria bacterium RIFCSPLOWO2_12_FULL_38_15 TaxID=1817883 RepID=A0A1F7SFI4_9BACT|nr:MAG: arsenite S-adenosylmethyltransferase [Candidatus Schekmanbacteria bacterium GWA2_38_9]OGL48546.1 MAG: arsenite S-adenosylmethyltransferase [Candidatus Schekmanbacteria bacterium RIFCSPLOWO2_02_FULL_38_14]OGL52525.1 MAG: arsenite S-adenosylmethyltransferase [Candidatus Schekmanbacteria bacterium RIFCSPLOWO2_12_FULL_38_15]OGL53821.1 MAG: arsenite S-adenosylmethyltransferase [Candidatus Schekmanbacteria bacterium RIFCSPHIGHO2_02_FULL_38_11]